MLALDQNGSLRDERGAALLLTIILMMVLSLLTVTLFELLQASTQIAGNHRQDLQAINTADAGVEDAINRLRIDPDDTAAFSGDLSGGTYGTYEVSIATVADPVFYRERLITSTGTFRDITRTLNVHIGILRSETHQGPTYAVVTKFWKL